MAAPQNSVIQAAAEPQEGSGNSEPNDSDLHIPNTAACSGGMRFPRSEVLLLFLQTES